jgi:hypothetical protein
MRAVEKTRTVMANCCRDALLDIATAASQALLHQTMLHFQTKKGEQAVFNDDLAAAAMLSPNKDVVRAAVRYRNERMKDKNS